MTHPFAPLERIERAARRGRGVRLDAGETALLRRILELSDAATQAHLLASGAGDGPGLSASRSTGSGAGADGRAEWQAAPEGEAPWEEVLVPRGTSR